ncbi:putative Flavin-containing monooxygenase protein [Naja naja]|nr:putative Flavin-containing monooxygenase protein [Naja naja]
MVKKVAIVGAGVSGLTSIKCCLEEGLEPTCFEQSDDIGGLWRFTTKVISIKKCPDFSNTGQWEIVIEANGKQSSTIFDAVMVCVGYLTEPLLPLKSYSGLEKFNGHYFHSREYKTPEVFRDKKVLVIGMGNSGVDIAVEATQTAKKVMISTERGSWVISRVFDNGYPWDMVFLSRFLNIIRNSLPGRITVWMIANRVSQWFNHANYGLIPKDRRVMREPVLNDLLPSCIITGKISIMPAVKEFKENAVVFVNVPTAEEVDTVVFATGYKASFPFIDESILKVENRHASLYKYIFLPQLEKPTLAIIGFIRPFGLCKLPPPKTMMEEINEKKNNKVNRFGLSFDEVLKTDCLVYCDELGSFIGIKPSVPALLLKDPILAVKIFFGPCSPYQYRLTGPGKWDGARNAILNQWDRVLKPLRTRVVEDSSNCFSCLLKGLAVFVILVGIYLSFN